MTIINYLAGFTPGTKALSSDMNSNFEILKEGHNDHETMIANVENDIANLETSKANDDDVIKKNASVPFSGLQSYSTDLIPGDDKNLTPKKYVDDLVAGIDLNQPAYVPYSVNSGAVDSLGYASFISFKDNSTVTVLSTETNILLTYPDGSQETISSDYDVSGIYDNATTILIKEKNNSTIHKTTNITESNKVPSGGSDGDYWLQISVKPYKPFKKVAGVWTETQFVKLGEATKSLGVLGTPISYALNGKYRFEDNSVLPAFNSKTEKKHNIGTTNVTLSAIIRCMNAELGWTVGQYCGNAALQTINYVNNSLSYHIGDRNTMFFLQSCSGVGLPVIQNISNNNYGATLTLDNWSLVWIAERGF